MAGFSPLTQSGPAPSGPAGGDLSGTYPNPNVARVKRNTTTDMAGVVKASGAVITEATSGTDYLAPADIGGGWTVITKPADESVTNSITLQNDDDLLFADVAAAVYELQFNLIYASPAGLGAPDIKWTFGEDATARGLIWGTRYDGADAVNYSQVQADQTTPLTAGTAAANRVGLFFGWYIGNGGTFRVLWAQNTANANPTILRAGSVMRYRRII